MRIQIEIPTSKHSYVKGKQTNMFLHLNVIIIIILLLFLICRYKAEFRHYQQGSGRILFGGLDCVGDESSILLCPGNPVGQELCDHGQDVGVICNTGKIEYCSRAYC